MVPDLGEVALTRPYLGPSEQVQVPNHRGPSDIQTSSKGDQGSSVAETEKEELQLKWEQILGQKFTIVVSLDASAIRGVLSNNSNSFWFGFE